MNEKKNRQFNRMEASLVAISGLTNRATQDHFADQLEEALLAAAGKGYKDQLTPKEKYEAAFFWILDHYDTVAGLVFAVATLADQALEELEA